MVKGYIYRHWIINDKGIEKSYIGQTITKVEDRWQNGRGYTGSETRFAKAIKKYGWDNFNHEIILAVERETREELRKELNVLESFYIEEFDSFYNGYNSTTGGDNYILSEESVAKMCHKVVCLNTGDIFNSMTDAKQWLIDLGADVPKGSVGMISVCCSGSYKRALKHPLTGEHLVWVYYEDYINMTQDEINDKLTIGTKDVFHNSTYENMDKIADTFEYKNIHELDKEIIENLQPMMKMFSPMQKLVFIEYYINGKNMREIATEQNVTTTRIGNLTKQIIKKITEQYTYEEFANLLK